jgi:hypothetical protein
MTDIVKTGPFTTTFNQQSYNFIATLTGSYFLDPNGDVVLDVPSFKLTIVPCDILETPGLRAVLKDDLTSWAEEKFLEIARESGVVVPDFLLQMEALGTARILADKVVTACQIGQLELDGDSIVTGAINQDAIVTKVDGSTHTLKFSPEGDTLILSGGNNRINLLSADDPNLTSIQTGNGDNTITSDVVNLKINLGTGHNIIGHLGMGTLVNAQGGGNKFLVSDDVEFDGLTPTDEVLADGMALRGAVGFLGSEDPWIVGPNGTRYGLNFKGDLVIEDMTGAKTYVANYHGGPDVPYAEQTAGIFVGLAAVYAERLLDLERPYIENVHVMFKLGNEMLYTRTGKTFFNNDPLVFDLGGTGVNLTTLGSRAPALDMRGNGFAVHTGWVGANDGILVLQQAGQGGTPTITEMFGGSAATGFAALAQYDANADGVIDANDAVYTQLRMWVDVNGNGTVDTGELETLAQAGVVSISLAAAMQTA